MQMRQALLLGLSFNMYRLKHRHLFLRMSTEPTHLINASAESGSRQAEAFRESFQRDAYRTL
jgi:hypothetical protein